MTVFSFQCLKAERLDPNKSTWKTGERERGWERHERHDERSNEVRSDEEDAGTGQQGEGVHEHGPCTLEYRGRTQGGFHFCKDRATQQVKWVRSYKCQMLKQHNHFQY